MGLKALCQVCDSCGVGWLGGWLAGWLVWFFGLFVWLVGRLVAWLVPGDVHGWFLEAIHATVVGCSWFAHDGRLLVGWMVGSIVGHS